MARTRGMVLYVEDEEGDRFLMETAFAYIGLEGALQVVTNGRLAVDYLSASGVGSRPSLNVVLLDLNLPEINGFDVLKWIRAHPLHTALPVEVFTLSERDEDRSRAKLLGATGFLQKPSSLQGFQEVARRLSERYLIGSCEAGALQSEESR